MTDIQTEPPNPLSILGMADRLGITLDPSAMRILSQSLTLLSASKGLPVGNVTCKTQSTLSKKWQVYTVNSYDEQLYYHFQQICMILELI